VAVPVFRNLSCSLLDPHTDAGFYYRYSSSSIVVVVVVVVVVLVIVMMINSLNQTPLELNNFYLSVSNEHAKAAAIAC
jgi:hypothetical protein